MQYKVLLSYFKFNVELVSRELNHFGVIAGLFQQIGGHSSRFVPFCSFWRLLTTKMIKSVKVFPFSFWKIIRIFFFFIKFKPQHKHAKWPPSDSTPWTLTLIQSLFRCQDRNPFKNFVGCLVDSKTPKYPFKINYLTFNLPSIYSSLIFSTGSKSSGSSISKDWFSSWTDFSCFCKLVLFKEV